MENFPTILETEQQRAAVAAFQFIQSNTSRCPSPSTPQSGLSTATNPSPFPEPMDMDSDCQSPAACLNKKREARHELLDSPNTPTCTKRIKAARTKKPRLELVKKTSFSSTGENEALKVIGSLAPPGYSIVRNQPYKTKDCVVQVYTCKCSGKCRHGCSFQAKIMYFCPELKGKIETSKC